MAKTAAMKNRGDALVLSAPRNVPVNIKVEGKGGFVVALQSEIGSPGSGAWEDIKRFTEEVETSYTNTKENVQALRLVVKRLEEKASVSLSMEIPAEEEPEEEEEEKLRERQEAEFVPASEEAVEEDKAQKAEAESRTTTTSTSTSKKG